MYKNRYFVLVENVISIHLMPWAVMYQQINWCLLKNFRVEDYRHPFVKSWVFVTSLTTLYLRSTTLLQSTGAWAKAYPSLWMDCICTPVELLPGGNSRTMFHWCKVSSLFLKELLYLCDANLYTRNYLRTRCSTLLEMLHHLCVAQVLIVRQPDAFVQRASKERSWEFWGAGTKIIQITNSKKLILKNEVCKNEFWRNSLQGIKYYKKPNPVGQGRTNWIYMSPVGSFYLFFFAPKDSWMEHFNLIAEAFGLSKRIQTCSSDTVRPDLFYQDHHIGGSDAFNRLQFDHSSLLCFFTTWTPCGIKVFT